MDSMDYKRLAQAIRRFDSNELLADEIETLASMIDLEIPDVETIDDLSGYLEEELDWMS